MSHTGRRGRSETNVEYKRLCSKKNNNNNKHSPVDGKIEHVPVAIMIRKLYDLKQHPVSVHSMGLKMKMKSYFINLPCVMQAEMQDFMTAQCREQILVPPLCCIMS